MSATLSIPAKTRERLANPAPPGQRHAEIVNVATSLISSGLNPEAVFCQIRPGYGGDVPDSEIRGVIAWAEKRISGNRRNSQYPLFSAFSDRKSASNRPVSAFEKRNNPLPIRPETAINRFLGGFTCEEADLWEASPVRLPDRFEADAETLLTALYRPDEGVNIVERFAVNGGKAQPNGCGFTRKREEWLSRFRENGPPVSESGVWVRPNPVDGTGVSDKNVTAFRFALLEIDAVPLAAQLPFIARLPVPIAAVISSGGKSLHAWVFIGAETAAEYRETVAVLFRLTAPFGIDTANRNPSRLSRLPGGFRAIGASGDNRQRLLYLNPLPKWEPIFK